MSLALVASVKTLTVLMKNALHSEFNLKTAKLWNTDSFLSC